MSQRETALDRENFAAASNGDPNQTPSASRIPRRALVAGLLFAILVVGGLIAIQAVFGNRIPELTAAKLEEAEQLWDQAGPASYDMDLEIRGAQPGRVRIEVRHGEVTKTSRDGRVPRQHTWDVWTVPGQFETLERELELAEDPEHEMQATMGTQLFLRCEFDPKFGFPRQYHRHVSGGGPEVYWRVTNFTPK